MIPPPYDPSPAPDDWELVGASAVERLRSLGRLAVARPAHDASRSLGSGATGATPTPRPVHRSPRRTPCSTARSPRNDRVAFARVPLAQVKEIKNAYAATVNDVLLATCALAMRRYLEDRKGLPDRAARHGVSRLGAQPTTNAASRTTVSR